MTLRSVITACAVALVLGAAAPAVFAQQPNVAAPIPLPPKAEKKPIFIDPAQFDPKILLPPPPAENSAQTKAELAELRQIQKTRTKAELDAAIADDKQEDIFIFASVFGAGFNEKALPKTAALGKRTRSDMGLVENAAKTYFVRPRPWYVDHSIKGCPVEPGKEPMSSYPSGHTSSGYVLGVVLASIAPDKAQAIMERARVYGEHRLTCGVHYRSDLQASEVLATLVAFELMRSPVYMIELRAAADEMRGAGLLSK